MKYTATEATGWVRYRHTHTHTHDSVTTRKRLWWNFSKYVSHPDLSFPLVSSRRTLPDKHTQSSAHFHNTHVDTHKAKEGKF